MSVQSQNGLSNNGIRWVLASYVFNAKLKVDSLSYIAMNYKKIPSRTMRCLVEPLYYSFFVECAAVIDNHISLISDSISDEKRIRKELKNRYAEIGEIYYWRDKFAAHHDLDALGYGLCGSFNEKVKSNFYLRSKCQTYLSRFPNYL